MLEAVSEQEMKKVILKLIALAKAGNVAAIKELLDRAVGKAPQTFDPDGTGDTVTQIVVWKKGQLVE